MSSSGAIDARLRRVRGFLAGPGTFDPLFCRLLAMAATHFLRPMLRTNPLTCTLVAHGRDEPLARSLIPAFDSASRRRGLLGRDRLADGVALIIAPSSAVHTFRMQFPIDLVYARRDGRVLKVRESVPPNRMSGAWGAFAVIELPAGTIARVGVQAGDQLAITI